MKNTTNKNTPRKGLKKVTDRMENSGVTVDFGRRKGVVGGHVHGEVEVRPNIHAVLGRDDERKVHDVVGVREAQLKPRLLLHGRQVCVCVCAHSRMHECCGVVMRVMLMCLSPSCVHKPDWTRSSAGDGMCGVEAWRLGVGAGAPDDWARRVFLSLSMSDWVSKHEDAFARAKRKKRIGKELFEKKKEVSE